MTSIHLPRPATQVYRPAKHEAKFLVLFSVVSFKKNSPCKSGCRVWVSSYFIKRSQGKKQDWNFRMGYGNKLPFGGAADYFPCL